MLLTPAKIKPRSFEWILEKKEKKKSYPPADASHVYVMLGCCVAATVTAIPKPFGKALTANTDYT